MHDKRKKGKSIKRNEKSIKKKFSKEKCRKENKKKKKGAHTHVRKVSKLSCN